MPSYTALSSTYLHPFYTCMHTHINMYLHMYMYSYNHIHTHLNIFPFLKKPSHFVMCGWHTTRATSTFEVFGHSQLNPITRHITFFEGFLGIRSSQNNPEVSLFYIVIQLILYPFHFKSINANENEVKQ